MNKEKEIRDIAKTICCHSFKAKSENEECDCPFYSKEYNSCDNRHLALNGSARRLYAAGYRKADEVRKETAQAILQELYDITFERKDPYSDSDEAKEVIDRAEILHTAKMYGVEVD